MRACHVDSGLFTASVSTVEHYRSGQSLYLPIPNAVFDSLVLGSDQTIYQGLRADSLLRVFRDVVRAVTTPIPLESLTQGL